MQEKYLKWYNSYKVEVILNLLPHFNFVLNLTSNIYFLYTGSVSAKNIDRVKVWKAVHIKKNSEPVSSATSQVMVSSSSTSIVDSLHFVNCL